MKQKHIKILVYTLSIALALSVGALSAAVNAGKPETGANLLSAPLSPPAWLTPPVWGILITLMGISAAEVWLSHGSGSADALFIYCIQLVVYFLWTVFCYSFGALLLSFFWLVFLILLAALMAVRFERCVPGAGKRQIPYLLWLGFSAYLNLAAWVVNR